MRVAIDIEQLFYRAPGGTGRYSARLASTLAREFSSDSVLPFCAWHSRSELRAAFRRFELDESTLLPCARLPLSRPLLLEAWHRARQPRPAMFSASFRAADLVHIPFPAVPPVKQPLVVSVFDAGFALFPEAYTARGRHFHARALSLVARRADAVLTATHAAAAEIAAFSPVPAHLLRVVPLGVDHRRPGPGQVQEALARLGLHGAPYVLWVGSLEPRKGLGTLVKAFAKLAKAGAFPHRLVLAGPAGWLHEGLIDDADKLALGDRLRAVGPVSESDLVSLYAGASVFAFPSWHEGFGLPVLEAMAQGTPVVCSDIASLAEVSGGAARLVPPGEVDLWADALGELVGDESARTTLAAAGTERASGYTWETTARLAHEIYQELT